MLRRELAIALRARVTWLSAALAALLVGHGFVLAIDIFGSESRSALASALLVRGMDPRAGIVAPTLGGVELATALLVPLVACRVLAVEKERGGFRALALQTGSQTGVLMAAGLAAGFASLLFLVPPVVLFTLFRALGGHIDATEVAASLLGHALHLAMVVGFSVAAAAWTETVALATTLAIVASLVSWAIDASGGFVALAWLGSVERWSVTPHLAPFDHGVLEIGSVLWLLAATGGALALAVVGVHFDWSERRRVASAVGIAALTLTVLAACDGVKVGVDATEARRMSFPPAVVSALRALPSAPVLEVWLDREDSRRTQLEREVLSKLRLARPDARLRMPLDAQEASHAAAASDERYGVIDVGVGNVQKETRASSAEEIVSLVFEAAGQPAPDWSGPEYPGYPFVLEGPRRTLALVLAYALVPLVFAGADLWLSRSRRRL
ncbi:MAG TPA: hypothetical protein VGI39_04405 [Polyangiaceae bacterium]